MQRTVRTDEDMAAAVYDLGNMKRPFRQTLLAGVEKRSDAQNRTIHKWHGEIAAQLSDVTMMEVKAENNLTYGAPILRRDDPEWSGAWSALFAPLVREKQLKAIRLFDVPFTRKMTVIQLTEYMEQMMRDYQERGIRLTVPGE